MLGIKFAKIKDLGLVISSILKTAKLQKYILASLAILLIISFIGLTASSYNSFTKKESANSEIFREAVVGGDFQFFVPTLDRSEGSVFSENNAAEKRVNALIYAPLYIVNDSDSDSITPVLLSEAPKWQDENDPDSSNRFKSLYFKLKDDIKWSDGSAIDTNDIRYTFDRLKEEKGSPKFNSVLEGLFFQKISDKEFVIKSNESRPEILRQLNFSPISADYFEDLNNEGLLASGKSIKPLVASGYYKIIEDQVDYPFTKKKDLVDNPVRDGANYELVVLEKNSYNNYPDDFGSPNFDKYVVKKYEPESVDSEQPENGIDTGIQRGEVDLIISNSVDLGDNKTLESLNIESSQYTSLFFNLDSGQYLVNQSLRKYIVCSLLNYSDDGVDSKYKPVEEGEKVSPINLNRESKPNCPQNPQDALESDKYKIVNGEQGKNLTLFDQELSDFSIIGLPSNRSVVESVAKFIKEEVGIDASVVIDEYDSIQGLSSRDFQIAVIDHDVSGSDLVSLFGDTGDNLIGTPPADRVAGYNLQQSLLDYSSSDGANKAASDDIFNFFTSEYALFNLYQINSKLYYNTKLINFESIDFNSTDPEHVYSHLKDFYFKVKRKFLWQ